MNRWAAIVALTLLAVLMFAGCAGKQKPEVPAFSDDPQQFIYHVREKACGHYSHGVPYEPSHALGPDALPILEAMLTDPRRVKNHVYIVLTIGHIGDDRGFDILRNYIENQQLTSDEEMTDRAWVYYAIGCVAGQGSDRALEYLLHFYLPEHWSSENTALKNGLCSENAKHCYNLAILGLGMSGRPKAKAVLEEILADPNRQSLHSTAELALQYHDKVMAKGFAGFFKRDPSEELKYTP